MKVARRHSHSALPSTQGRH